MSGAADKDIIMADYLLTRRRGGFTLAEVLVVVMILGIAAIVAVPMLGNTDQMRVESAARQLASTLLYAQTTAISSEQQYQVVFDSTGTGYEVQDAGGNVAPDPLITTQPYRVDYATDKRLSKVRIASASFDGQNQVWFDRLGSPYAGTIVASPPPLTNGQVVVQAGNESITVLVEPVTGRVRIQ